MSLNTVSAGANAPDEFNVVIEIPMNADQIKYEVDKESGAILQNRMDSEQPHLNKQVIARHKRLSSWANAAHLSCRL